MGIILHESSLVSGGDDSAERLSKEQEYMEYINNHIANVQKAYATYFLPLLNINNISSLVSDEELKQAIENNRIRIETHDASKYSDDEFYGYRQKWYPTRSEQNADDEYHTLITQNYEKCWEHHYTVNDHHPLHWVDKASGIVKDMTLDAIVEMLCDWEGMSMKFGGSTVDWYTNKAQDEKKAMSTKTKQIVEDLLFNVLHGNGNL
jgi:hypothetical protein